MRFGLALALLALAMPALAGDPAAVAVLTSVENPAEVHVTRGANTFSVTDGFGLYPGDVIHVGPRGSARLEYPDESTLTIAEGSEVHVEAPVAGMPSVALATGNVYAQIQRKAGSANEHRLKFFLRTKSVVMGVRGTQFVADESAAEGSSVHTLEGSVECAPDQKGLDEGRGVAVTGSHALTARSGVLSRISSFNPRQFLARHRARFPAAHRVLTRFREAARKRALNGKAKATKRHRRAQRDWKR